jgi:phosphoglycolate phosphatase-like HAD superfamily hydrolase
MLKLSSYDVYIFDCDGVILDSNKLKIDAMKHSLTQYTSNSEHINACIAYFGSNFGKSRFHHVDIFINEILSVDECKKEKLKTEILTAYSNQCKQLYLKADISPGFINFIQNLHGSKYVASGSEQQELRDIFKIRALSDYFTDVFGSPIAKSDLIGHILKKENSCNAIMFGDSESDFNSACINDIDFVFYAPFSTVKNKMLSLCDAHQFPIINDFSTIEVL